jgi:uncharacterized membrane protein YkvA (DUF1232 family)
MQFLSFRVIFKRIKAITSMMRDKTVSKWKKLLIVAGVAYLLTPVDLIPPVLFPFGWLDDVILWLWILWCLKDTLDAYWMGEKVVDLSKSYKGKKIISDVEYEVEKDRDK